MWRIYLLVFILAQPVSAQVRTDFDADNSSDLIYFTNGAENSWLTAGALTGETITEESFGIDGDLPAPGYWLEDGLMSFAVVRNRGESLVWKMSAGDGVVRDFTFGRSGDMVISGGDFDGNGLSDAAVTRYSGNNIAWELKPNPLQPRPRTKKITFGKMGDRIFYARLAPTGRDLLGVFGRNGAKSEARLRDIDSKRVRTYRFPKALSGGERPRPVPVHSAEGGDLLLFMTQDQSDTTLLVYSISGRLRRRITLKGLGTAVPGDFDPEVDGEEIAYSSNSLFKIYYPQTGEIGDLPDRKSGRLISDYCVGLVAAPAVE